MTITETSTETEIPAPLQSTQVPPIGTIIGPTGPQGTQGYQGVTGSQGPQGNTGVQGPQGPSQGVTGAQGPQGFQGVQGAGETGPQGNTGGVGPVGPQGVIGNTGVQGPQGNQGSVGGMGNQGVQGTQGVTGPQGFQGVVGNTGANGPQGPQGSQGFQGSPGSITGTAGGDLSGSYPNPTVVKLYGSPISSTPPSSSMQGLVWTGTMYAPSNVVQIVSGSANIAVGGTAANPTISLTGTAGGDLGNSYPNPAVLGILGFPLNWTTPAYGEGSLLMYDGNQTGGAHWSTVAANPSTWSVLTWWPGTGGGPPNQPQWIASPVVNSLGVGAANQAGVSNGLYLAGVTGFTWLSVRLPYFFTGLSAPTVVTGNVLTAVLTVTCGPIATYKIEGVCCFTVTSSTAVDIALYDLTHGTYLCASSEQPFGALTPVTVTLQHVFTTTVVNQLISIALYCVAGININVKNASSSLGVGYATTLSAVAISN